MVQNVDHFRAEAARREAYLHDFQERGQQHQNHTGDKEQQGAVGEYQLVLLGVDDQQDTDRQTDDGRVERDQRIPGQPKPHKEDTNLRHQLGSAGRTGLLFPRVCYGLPDTVGESGMLVVDAKYQCGARRDQRDWGDRCRDELRNQVRCSGIYFRNLLLRRGLRASRQRFAPASVSRAIRDLDRRARAAESGVSP